jgi:CRISPR/Cas system CSM-associated protein Csm3 (group 7 of RAMP superfamily)
MSLKVTNSGYWFVELPDWKEVNQRKKKVVSHARFEPNRTSGEITCIMTAKTPIHVGAGFFELGKDAGYAKFDGVVKAIIKEDGFPIIPGSSLKGAFRSISEAISYSCTLGQIKGYGFPPCEANDEKSKICVACSIYGAMGFMGRVSFTQATLVKQEDYLKNKPDQPIELIAFNPPNERKAQRGRKFYPPIDYFSPDFWKNASPDKYYISIKRAHREHGHLVVEENYPDLVSFKKGKAVEPYDFIPAGTQLKFNVKFENLRPEEIGLVLAGMGINEENQPLFFPRLGGAKPLRFGVIQVQAKDFKLDSEQSDFTNFDSHESSVHKTVEKWVKGNIQAMKTSDLFFEKGLERITNLLKYPAEKPEVVDWPEVFDEFKK